MAKKITIDIEVNGKMQKATVSAKKLRSALDGVDTAQKRVGKTARTADRNLKGAAQATSNSTKAFSKMGQGMGGLVGIYASFAAQVFALSAAFGFLKRAADLENLRAAQTDFAASSGLAIRKLTADLQESSSGMLAFQEAAQAAAIGVAKGFSGAQLEQLTVGAVKASKALGNSFDDTFSRLLRGVSKAEPELLDELGITLRLETATEAYAQAIGKSRNALTEAERSQAVFVETMRQLNNTFGDVSAQGNPFIELQVTFQKIVEDITAKVLPSVTKVVDVINSNAKIAAGAFSALTALIVLNLAGFGGAVGKMMAGIGTAVGFVSKKTTGAVAIATKTTGKSIGSFIQKQADDLEFAALLLEEKLQKVGSDLQASAQKAVEGGAGSKTLGKLALGKEVTPRALGRLKKDLQRVRKDIEEMGETASKAFAGITVSAIDEMTEEIKEFEKELSTGEKKIPLFRKSALVALKAVQKGANLTAASVRSVGTMFDFARKHADKAKKAFRFGGGILAGILIISKAVDKLAESPLRVIDGFKAFVLSTAKLVQRALNIIITGINNLLSNSFIDDVVSRFYDTSEGIFSDFTFADNLASQLDELEKKALALVGTDRQKLAFIQGQFDFNKGLIAQEEKRVQLAKDLVEEYSTLAKDLQDIFDGRAGEGDFAAQLTAIGSADLLGARTALTQFDEMLVDNQEAINRLVESFIDTPEALRDAELFKRTEASLRDTQTELTEARRQASDLYTQAINSPEFKKLPQVFRDALATGSDETVSGFQIAALSYGATLSSLEGMGQNLRNTLGSGDPMQLQIGLEEMNKAFQRLQEIEQLFGVSDDRNETLMESLLGKNWYEIQPQLEALGNELERIRKQKNDLLIKEEGMRGVPAAVKAERQLAITVERANLALSEKQALLAQMGLRTQFNSELDRRAHDLAMEQTRREIKLMREKLLTAQRNEDQAARLGDTAMQALETGMASAVNSIVQGTATIKEAFRSMALSVVQALAQIIAKMIAVRIMSGFLSLIPGFGLASAATTAATTTATTAATTAAPVVPSIPQFRYGGVMEKSYATGGIARGPDAGYMATLHGTEAVVPLPNGREIPVQLTGAGQQNNVTVNVAVDNQGNAQTNVQNQEGQAKQLGVAISAAVQQELAKQKRAGGMLSPYGVS